MEDIIKIKTPDKYTIFGTLNKTAVKNNKLIIFIHELTGNQNEHLFFNASRFFPKNGLDVFRFNLYDGRKGTRSLVGCTVRIHAQDLNQVVKRFRNDYHSIFVIGHSLGGPTILQSNTDLVDGIVLLDPTSMPSLLDVVEGTKSSLKFIKSLNAYSFDWGTTCLLGKEMSKEFGNLNLKKLMKTVNKPIKLIFAEKGNAKYGKRFFQYANQPKELTIIKGATHCFDEEGAEDKVFKETLSWLKRF